MLCAYQRLLCITIYVQLFQLLCVSRAARHHIYVCFNSIVSIFVFNPRVSPFASSAFIKGCGCRASTPSPLASASSLPSPRLLYSSQKNVATSLATVVDRRFAELRAGYPCQDNSCGPLPRH